MAALRILIASSVYPPKIGGPATQAELFARALGRLGAEVRVLTYGPPAAGADGVTVEYLDCSLDRGVIASLGRFLSVARQVNRLFRSFKPDVVQTQTPTGAFALIVGLAARLHGTPSWVKFAADPVIQLRHEQKSGVAGRGLSGWKRGLRAAIAGLLARLVFRTYRFAWATGPAVADELKRRWGVPEDRIVIAPNLVDLKDVASPDHRETGPGEPFRLLIVARLQQQKGIDVAIRALAELDDRWAVLRVVGEGDERYAAHLRGLARELGVSDRVEWAGSLGRRQVAEEYRRAHLLLVPSRYEPFGMVIIEAMTSSLPVIASNTGGIPFVVNDGECARLVEPDDPGALARAIMELGRDPGEMRRLKAAGLGRAREFDAKAGVAKWLDTYRQMSAAQRGR